MSCSLNSHSPLHHFLLRLPHYWIRAETTCKTLATDQVSLLSYDNSFHICSKNLITIKINVSYKYLLKKSKVYYSLQDCVQTPTIIIINKNYIIYCCSYVFANTFCHQVGDWSRFASSCRKWPHTCQQNKLIYIICFFKQKTAYSWCI